MELMTSFKMADEISRYSSVTVIRVLRTETYQKNFASIWKWPQAVKITVKPLIQVAPQ